MITKKRKTLLTMVVLCLIMVVSIVAVTLTNTTLQKENDTQNDITVNQTIDAQMTETESIPSVVGRISEATPATDTNNVIAGDIKQLSDAGGEADKENSDDTYKNVQRAANTDEIVNYRAQLPSPYKIAASLEEVRAILKSEDGTIPLTNVEVPEIMNGEANGIIITEQDLNEALAVLNYIYRMPGGYIIKNEVTVSIGVSGGIPNDEKKNFDSCLNEYLDYGVSFNTTAKIKCSQ